MGVGGDQLLTDMSPLCFSSGQFSWDGTARPAAGDWRHRADPGEV